MTECMRMAFFVCAVCLLSFTEVSCPGKNAAGNPLSDSFEIKYTDIVPGETSVALKAAVTLITHRTDMATPDYTGRSWDDYIRDFNSLYPNIQVSVEALTDYDAATTRMLDRGNWGDIMMIPALEKKQYSRYFVPLGTVEEISRTIRFADQFAYDGRVYGIASAGNLQGIIYNKRIFHEAGVMKLPKTPDEFLMVLRLVKLHTKAVPLYTNYAARWPLDQWDYYTTVTATGDSGFLNYTLPRKKNPFADSGSGSGARNVYRILYQAAAEGLIEEDFTTTDWEGCKGMMNRGGIAAMALGSWAFTQVQSAGGNPADIGYMPFPMQIDGMQVACARPDRSFAVNVRSKGVRKLAALIFIKWMVENSGFQYNEGELPVLLSDSKLADVYEAFEKSEIMEDAAAPDGEEGLLDRLNADSGLGIGQGGAGRMQELIEHAVAGDMSFAAIMDDWNERWSRAQEQNGISAH